MVKALSFESTTTRIKTDRKPMPKLLTRLERSGSGLNRLASGGRGSLRVVLIVASLPPILGAAT